VTALAFGFVSVMVSSEASPVAIEPGLKDFATARPSATLSVSLAATVLVPALVLVSAPAASVLV
jgi:hypothetical protein